jgi:hypothetical protein
MYKQGYSRNASQDRSRNAHASPRSEPRVPRVQPKSEPAVLASAIRLKNFRQLHELVGEENLAMALDFPLQRVRELHEGINFSDETTFHLENTLGLRSGYFDQVNPQLSDDDVKRLKSPLEHASPAERLPEPPNQQEIPVPHSVKSANETSPQSKAAMANPVAHPKANGAPSKKSPKQKTVAPTAEDQQSLLTQDTPESTVATAPTAAAAAPAPAAPAPAAPAPASTPAATAPAAHAAPGGIDTDELRLREVRRGNLMLITQQPGSKSHLGRITDMSPANISHRLHGNKHFDNDTAQMFCEKLKLPEGWFNEPHEIDDVPAHVFELLGGSPRANVPSNRGGRPSTTRRSSSQAAAAPAPTPAAPPAALDMPATRDAGPALRHAGIASASQLSPEPALSMGPSLSSVRPAATRPQPAAMAQPAPAPAAYAPEPAAAPAPVQAAPMAVAAPAPAASPIAAVLAAPGEALNPIAEALIKTLALKARQGKLTEENAFKFLTEAMAL